MYSWIKSYLNLEIISLQSIIYNKNYNFHNSVENISINGEDGSDACRLSVQIVKVCK